MKDVRGSESEKRGKTKTLTPCGLRADLTVAGVVCVATGVANAGVDQALSAAEVLAVQVLDAPEAARGDSGLLGALGDRHRRSSSSPAGAGYPKLLRTAGHGAEEPREEVGEGESGGHDGDCG